MDRKWGPRETESQHKWSGRRKHPPNPLSVRPPQIERPELDHPQAFCLETMHGAEELGNNSTLATITCVTKTAVDGMIHSVSEFLCNRLWVDLRAYHCDLLSSVSQGTNIAYLLNCIWGNTIYTCFCSESNLYLSVDYLQPWCKRTFVNKSHSLIIASIGESVSLERIFF